MNDTEKILLCVVTATATAILFRFLLGEKRDLWFRRSVSKSFITFRSKLAEHVALGHPVTLKGYAATAVLLAVIAAEILAIIKFL